MSFSLCVTVCLFSCPPVSISLEPRVQPSVLCLLLLAVVRSSSGGVAIRYVLPITHRVGRDAERALCVTSDFVDDAMFSDIGLMTRNWRRKKALYAVAGLEFIDGGRTRGSGGRKSPRGVQRRSPGGGLGAKTPEADDIYLENNYQKHRLMRPLHQTLYDHYLPTVILIIIGIPSPTHSFTLGLNPSFSANPPYRSLSFFSFWIHYMDFPDCLLYF